jgi:hypothetical protein
MNIKWFKKTETKTIYSNTVEVEHQLKNGQKVSDAFWPSSYNIMNDVYVMSGKDRFESFLSRNNVFVSFVNWYVHSSEIERVEIVSNKSCSQEWKRSVWFWLFKGEWEKVSEWEVVDTP